MSEIRAKPHIDWLRDVAGLTVREISTLVGVSPITINTVWMKPPGYISKEKLERLEYIRRALEKAIESEEFTPAALPHPNSPRGGRLRWDMIKKVINI